MSSSSHPLDSVISLMRQMEEYRLGDWVAGARHEAQVELVIRNNEEIIFIDEEAEDTIIRNKEEENPEISVGTNYSNYSTIRIVSTK